MEPDFLVLVHGYLGSGAQWERQVPVFSQHFRVVCLDLPGYGPNCEMQSPDTIGGYAEYILSELDKQQIGSFHILGHSMGGMIAQEIVHRAPERVKMLVLYGTAAVGHIPGRFETMQESQELLLRHGVLNNARRISAKWFVNGVASQGYESCAHVASQTSLQAATAGLHAMQAWTGRDFLGSISCKTMLLWGEHDKTYLRPLQDEMCQAIPGATLHVVVDCCHVVHLEQTHLFNSVVLDFFKLGPS